MTKAERMEDLKKYSASSYYGVEDITEKLMRFSEIEDNGIKEELTDAIYQVKAMAENPYNSDCWKILYNVLLKFAEVD